MQIESQVHGAVTVLQPKGSLVAEDAEGFQDRLRETLRHALGRCVVDLSETTFIDSQGLEALVEVSDGLAGRGTALRVCAISPVLQEVFDLTGIGTRFDRYEDVNSAVRSFL